MAIKGLTKITENTALLRVNGTLIGDDDYDGY
jgi:hypothetical protein